MSFEIKNMTPELWEFFRVYYGLSEDLAWVDIDKEGDLDLDTEIVDPNWLGDGYAPIDEDLRRQMVRMVLSDLSLPKWNDGTFASKAEAFAKLKKVECTPGTGISCRNQLAPSVDAIAKTKADNGTDDIIDTNLHLARILQVLIEQYTDDRDPTGTLSLLYEALAEIYLANDLTSESRPAIVALSGMPAMSNNTEGAFKMMELVARIVTLYVNQGHAMAASTLLENLPKRFEFPMYDFVKRIANSENEGSLLQFVERLHLMKPTDADCAAALGYVYATKTEPLYVQAESAYQNAIKNVPIGSEKLLINCYQDLGNLVYIPQGQYDKAEVLYKQMATIEAVKGEAYVALAKLYEEQKLQSKADWAWEQKFEVDQNPEALYEKGMMYLRSGVPMLATLALGRCLLEIGGRETSLKSKVDEAMKQVKIEMKALRRKKT